MKFVLGLSLYLAFVLPGFGQELRNVATKGFAYQLSEWTGSLFPARYALDGDVKTFSHTAGNEQTAWWEVNLGGNYVIHSLEIYNRFDGNGQRLHDVTFSFITPDGINTSYVHIFPGAMNPSSTVINLPFPVPAQFIRVERSYDGADSILSLGEFIAIGSDQVPAEAPVSPGSVGAAGTWSVLQMTDAGFIPNLRQALNLLTSGSGRRLESNPAVINYFGFGTNHGNFATGETLLMNASNPTIPNSPQNLALSAKAHFLVPANQGDTYTFSVWADDSFELLVDGKVVAWNDGTNATPVTLPIPIVPFNTTDTSTQVFTNNVPPNILGRIPLTPGVHTIELIYFQDREFSHVELSAAKGSKTAFDASFKLVGDKAGGGLELVDGVAPQLTVEPFPVTLKAGESTNLISAATGSSSLNFQWFLEGQKITGETRPVLELVGVTTNQAGIYHVQVKNWAGQVESSQIKVTVIAEATDFDADGLGDEWEFANFGDLFVGPDDDMDGDGFTNLQEYVADTDPKSDSSNPRLIRLVNANGLPEITWSGGPNSRQVIQVSPTLGAGASWTDLKVFEPPNQLETTWLDDNSAGAVRFYRIKFERTAQVY